jgi:hypothetical protein
MVEIKGELYGIKERYRPDCAVRVIPLFFVVTSARLSLYFTGLIDKRSSRAFALLSSSNHRISSSSHLHINTALMVCNSNQAYHITKHSREQSNNNTTSSAVEELRLQQQCFRDEGDRFAEDALQVRIEDSQESSRQQETPVAATAAPAAAPTQMSGLQPRLFTPRADPTDLFDRSGRVWCKSDFL